jgi:preprotein translocase SecE subunit
VSAETRKVTWPTFKEVRDTTIVVIIAVFLFGIFLYFVDMALHRIIQYLFKIAA